MTGDQKQREQRAREAVRLAMKNVPELFSKDWNRKFLDFHMAGRDVEWLVSAAREGDRKAEEILRERARIARRDGSDVPLALHEFVWEFFIDGPAKARPGTNPKETEVRKRAIAILVKLVHRDYGFNVYSNPEHRGSDSGPMTALRIVGDELGLDARTVEEIYADRKDSVDPGAP
jgi:hypothetical protein